MEILENFEGCLVMHLYGPGTRKVMAIIRFRCSIDVLMAHNHFESIQWTALSILLQVCLSLPYPLCLVN